MRTWEHSGFSVDQSVLLAAGDQAGIERLLQYMTRCPFSWSRLVKVSDKGQVKSTPCRVRNVGARWRWWPLLNRRKRT